MRANPIRFTGMASGMDTDSIVRDLLRPQQHKIDNQKREQALLKLKQDAWKDMNKKLFDFHRNFTEKLGRGSTFNKNITTSSNENAISIKNDATVPEGTHTFDVKQLAQSASAVGKVRDGVTTVGELMGGAVPDKLVMRVDGTTRIEVDVAAGDTLEELAKNMNEALKDTGFTAKFDQKNNSFFINSTSTGKEKTIRFDANDENGAKLFEAMNLETGVNITGQDAKYTYNGSTVFTSATNEIEINGITATLKSAGTGPVIISSKPDTDGIYDFVKEFITEYNSLIDEINLKIGTKPGKDIMPLTAEERDTMSESEIKLWEDKINNSLFYQDEQLTSFVNSARSILGQVLGVDEGKPNSLAALGIVTGTWEEKGKFYIQGDKDLSLDPDKPNKLKEAIEKNPQDVIDLLTGIGADLYGAHDGVLTSSNKLKSAMNFYNDKVMTDKSKDFDKRISTLEERMYRMESMHYAKFAAMEKMLSSLNNQSSWLSQQFGGM